MSDTFAYRSLRKKLVSTLRVATSLKNELTEIYSIKGKEAMLDQEPGG